MGKKVFLNAGHGGSDTGAVKYLVEKDINLIMTKACRDYLTARGVEVLMGRDADVDRTSTQITNMCNSYNPDCAVDIHNNAGGGDGFEVYHSINSSSKGIDLARAIEAEVIKIGQNSRGLKSRRGDNGDYYYFIRQISCPSVICEGVFVDNIADAAQADTDEECRAFGVAYAKGILKYLGVSDSEVPSAPEKPNETEGYLVKITANNLNIRTGAGTNYGYAGSITDHGVYTIVAEADGPGATKWGKLKSGAGWISLDYAKKL
ncbi:MAG: N-acetylmuramoyl-L-alanine amidase [Clostridium sp.]|nr:N-acetylmuramoyl-L-alanine amidase [Clostridium sp.]MCM1172919.1 N-acetylmuramoyl-L-alanine amidase [Clostridium sp.]MCM1208591.1 N-acetylmuramoyl-L-alanine amidase [Ruminococcus sp.]